MKKLLRKDLSTILGNGIDTCHMGEIIIIAKATANAPGEKLVKCMMTGARDSVLP
ncbi:hypothetical protein [Chryseobacterium indologenes]|uniref:hypothetical protein n=1 Tax=Chryseobacterium indologenes TaxID=253 RepID=UPI0016290D88|nr:hypothetical protein [Chryseobacterium indologenes]